VRQRANRAGLDIALKLLRGAFLDAAIADADWGNDDAEEAPHLT